MNMMGYDALNAGQGELQAGPLAFRQLAEPGAPALISITVKAPDGQGTAAERPAPKAYLIREVSGVRMGLVGITAQDATAGGSGRMPAEALRPLLAELRGQADVIVALADLVPEDIQALATAGLGIDVVLGGRSAETREPAREGQAIVASAGSDGTYVGRLTLLVDAGGRITSFQGESNPLDGLVPANPDIARLRAQYP